ncbi:hypothetical protein F9Y84_11505 [Pseudoalteromonas peptidolytica]|nr:hypothetical protein [Pseudoalteromonas peptidolytica]
MRQRMTERTLFIDAFDTSNVIYQISEASEHTQGLQETSQVDGVGILARVVGPFFLVDGTSRNGRFYTRELWRTAIERSQAKISSGTMLGTIGHTQALDDQALLEGRASHRISKLWIDEKNSIGMGEILVLNTPAGRVLNAYLRGGVQFPVSSRGYGGYTPYKRDNAPVIDEASFVLETFDFVQEPGVAQAIPSLVESLDDEAAKLHQSILELANTSIQTSVDEKNETPLKTNPVKDTVMSESASTIAALAKQKSHVEESLAKAYAEHATLRSKNDSLNEQAKTQAEHIELLEQTLAEVRQLNSSMMAQLEDYKKLGSVCEVQAALSKIGGQYSTARTRVGSLSEQLYANFSVNYEDSVVLSDSQDNTGTSRLSSLFESTQ